MIDYVLGITSPLTAGPRVLACQRVLNSNNVFGKDFLLGAVDSVFGEETGRACIRAKFWIGYPTADLKPSYGPHLDGYLHGVLQPTPEMVRRAEIRQARVPLQARALAEARKHIGVKENPAGSNKCRFSDWYGMRGPWCAMYVSYCYVQAGSKAFVKGQRYAYVPYMVADARAGRNGLQVTRSPRSGDVVCFDWDGGVADHTGLFQYWLAGAEGSEFQTVEGNTAVGNDSNGGEVMERTRRIAQVEAFIRVGR